MHYQNVLNLKNRNEFREWLKCYGHIEKECYIAIYRGKPNSCDRLWYLDAVEEALCFGWIDSTLKNIDGVSFQRFSPRRKNSNWTELNKERVRRLEKLGLMTEAGRKVLPVLAVKWFEVDPIIQQELKKARVWSKFKTFPALYQRIRLSNLAFYRKNNPNSYLRMLKHTIEETKKGNMIGEWNDYGRLLNY